MFRPCGAGVGRHIHAGPGGRGGRAPAPSVVSGRCDFGCINHRCRTSASRRSSEANRPLRSLPPHDSPSMQERPAPIDPGQDGRQLRRVRAAQAFAIARNRNFRRGELVTLADRWETYPARCSAQARWIPVPPTDILLTVLPPTAAASHRCFVSGWVLRMKFIRLCPHLAYQKTSGSCAE